MTNDEQKKKFIEAIADSLTRNFEKMPLPTLLDAIQVNMNLYKAGKTNPMHFAVLLGIAATAFMTKIKEQADEEIKLYQAQPNPNAN